ncbi:MAG: M24 family metallopeptidase [Halobacteriovoraceae bacterium]|nr:M24 family metallopeptidase [Halobacteriovoraceae bacterium]MCB9093817.1 M24 family metallopeptidase [Halobacteriovoraceae bacterium]
MEFSLKRDQIESNIAKVCSELKDLSIDCLYVPSFDQNISEYVPHWNNLRYYFSGFTGSMGDVLLDCRESKAYLFVDGRYHLQADQQVTAKNIEVVKLENQMRIFRSLLDKALALGRSRLGVIAERVPFGQLEEIEKDFPHFHSLSQDEIHQWINFQNLFTPKKVFKVDEKLIGQSVLERIERVGVNKGEAFFLSATDDIAWASNCRGYHLPFMSSFLAKAVMLHDSLHIFVNQDVPIDDSALKEKSLSFYFYEKNFKDALENVLKNNNIKKVYFDKNSSTISDYQNLKSLSSVEVLSNVGLSKIKCIKLAVEVPEYERIFNKANMAIFETIQWVKEEVSKGAQISEKDLYFMTSQKYRKHGGVEQSFNTISGAGENGAIVHYGDPKEDRFIAEEDLVLLDSGGYFESGLATDTTRTFLANSNKQGPLFDEIKKSYTLVVKSQIAAEMAVFPEGTLGSGIDMLARQPLYRLGLDFKHGLGHGVGVHVHEPGVRLAPSSTIPMREGQFVSIEPGLYFEGKYGIRHENIAFVEKHPSLKGYLRFRSLVFIGIEECLVDENMLTPEELQYYKDYLSECQKRGTRL